MRFVLLAAALAVLATGVRLETRPAPPVAVRTAVTTVDDSAVARGHLVYQKYGCSSCHGTDGKGGFANANAETDGKVPGITFVAEGFTKKELRKKILDGFAAVGKKDANGPRPPFRMPGWSGYMSDREVTDLVEYLWSLYPKSETEKWR